MIFQAEEMLEIYKKYLKDNKGLDIELVGPYNLNNKDKKNKIDNESKSRRK